MKLSELLNLLKTAEIAEEMDVRREEIAALIPAVRTMFGYDQKNSAHQYDLWMHSLHVVCNLPRRMENDMVYLAALLHDIGRLQQYLTGEDHAAAGMRTAQEILRDTAFSASEQQAILQAVSKHRRGDTAQVLGRILCEADDASRMCFACAAQDTCYWPEHRKNNTILL